MKRFGTIIFLGLICVLMWMPVQSVQAQVKSVTGVCEYDNAYEVLELVNKERTSRGLNKIVMDQRLLDAAMMRAAETSVSFSHTRPNGKRWDTACSYVFAENIAYGYASPEKVMEAWMSSKVGHRENILNGDYCSIGIGVFYKEDVRYWVQCFGLINPKTAKKLENEKRTYNVGLDGNTGTTIANISQKIGNASSFKIVAGKRKLTVKWKKAKGVDGYQIQISTSKKFKNKKTYTLGKSKTQKVIKKYQGKKLKRETKYYVRIRAYKKVNDSKDGKTKIYSGWKKISKKTK